MIKCLEGLDEYKLAKFFISQISFLSSSKEDTRFYGEVSISDNIEKVKSVITVLENVMDTFPLHDVKVRFRAEGGRIISEILSYEPCELERAFPKKQILLSIDMLKGNIEIAETTKKLLSGFSIPIPANTSSLSATSKHVLKTLQIMEAIDAKRNRG
jgi:hypothetical protein